ncbi:MAG: paraquat-inducible protein A [Alysiella sp.]|uniref:paraquat-inducible protein A n=1 Tax=Alysiella sp. TaxID=1872483 RepID=UPI0026DBE155|nr:paraquat-inducible protein A [Alysiella sp.]MDO4433929.1 paraquat-inducible protein A [Alysiella sp.]
MSLRQHFVRKIEKHWQHVYTPSATLPAHIVDCPECACRVHLPKLRQGQDAACPRCHHHLVHIEPEAYATVLACAFAALILMLLVYSQPFANIQMQSVYSPLTLPAMLHNLLADNWGFLGLVMFALTFGSPVLFLWVTIYVYTGLVWQQNRPFLLHAIRLITRLRQWIMIDVFFISMLVAYIKIRSVAEITLGAAFWLMPFLILLLLRTAVAISPHWLYYQIHRRGKTPLFQAASDTVCCSRCLYFRPQNETFCGVCGSELFNRRPHSLYVSFMFLLAAIILYFPANFLTIMISQNPMTLEISTIMSGIIYMWHKGDRLIATIIFSASILVPTLKIISMLILLYCARFKPFISVEKLSLQYRLTEAVGRWSMIDIFVIIILMSTFYTPLARVTPGPAAIYFCLVVILTMLSAHFFDVRLLWDKHHMSQTETHTKPISTT